jgi:tetratricopeptide (TPR) repeat protein
MSRTTVRLATLLIGATIAVAHMPMAAFADGGGGGGAGAGDNTNPPVDSSKAKAKGKKKSEFLNGYRTAYATIYQQHDYKTAIAQLRALKQDHHPDVANLIGYSNRKLGNYEESKRWYEAALKADPTHVRTWQYYGLWQLEQGNQAQAKVHLDKIAAICGTSCPQYISLAEAMGVVAAGGRPVY